MPESTILEPKSGRLYCVCGANRGDWPQLIGTSDPVSKREEGLARQLFRFDRGKSPVSTFTMSRLSICLGMIPLVVGCSANSFTKRESVTVAAEPSPASVEATVNTASNQKALQTNNPFQLASARERVEQFATPNQRALADEAWQANSIARGEPRLDANHVTQMGPQVASVAGGATAGSNYRTIQPRDATSPPGRFRFLSESDMLSIAFQHSPVLRQLGVRILDNPAAAATVYDSAIASSDPFFGPQAALAAFDSQLSASINSQNNDRVFNNTTLGGDVQELTQDLVNINSGWQKITRSGATWDLGNRIGYDNNNRAGNSFTNYWETQLEFGVRQPLLRGAGRNFNNIAGPNARPGFNFSNGILIAQLNDRISRDDFQLNLRTYVRDLYAAYGDLAREYENYESVSLSRDLAYEVWQTVLAKSKAELEGGEANKEAQARAKYFSYRRQVQLALGGEGGNGGMYVTERRLRQLMGLPAIDGELLKPVRRPVSVKFAYDCENMAARAMTSRVELHRQSTRVHQQHLRLIAAKNFLLPQVDLIGRYRLRGFGDDLTGDGPRFASAQEDFFSFDHQEWEFGLEMGVARGRRQAKAAVLNAKLQLSREQAILDEQRRSVRHEVSDACAEVASAFAALESSLEQVAASRDRLQSSRALFAADKIQIEFLLDAQEELFRAETQLAADRARYSMSLINVSNVTGTLLRDIGINVFETNCASQVHYYPAS